MNLSLASSWAQALFSGMENFCDMRSADIYILPSWEFLNNDLIPVKEIFAEQVV